MIEWIIFVTVIILYVYYIYRRNGGASIMKWKFPKINTKETVVPETYNGSIEVFYYWIGALNKLVSYTNMRYYIFVDKLPLLKDTEEEILYCLMDKRVTASRKKPFFKTYIVTGGLYKEVDIAKYN